MTIYPTGVGESPYDLLKYGYPITPLTETTKPDKRKVGFHYHTNVGHSWAISPENLVDKAIRGGYGVLILGDSVHPNQTPKFESYQKAKAYLEKLPKEIRSQLILVPMVEFVDGKMGGPIGIFPNVASDLKHYMPLTDNVEQILERGGIPVLPYGFAGLNNDEIYRVMLRYRGVTFYVEKMWWYYSFLFKILGLKRDFVKELERIELWLENFPPGHKMIAAAHSHLGEGLQGELYNLIPNTMSGELKTARDVTHKLFKNKIKPVINNAPSVSETLRRSQTILGDYGGLKGIPDFVRTVYRNIQTEEY